MTIFQRLGDTFGGAISAPRLGVALYRLDQHSAALDMLERGLAGLRESGDRWYVTLALWELGEIAIEAKDGDR